MDRDAVDDATGSWLGDALPDVPLTLLRVTVPESAMLLPTNADYEIVVAGRIPPDSIYQLGNCLSGFPATSASRVFVADAVWVIC
jgi:hypothetical protein